MFTKKVLSLILLVVVVATGGYYYWKVNANAIPERVYPITIGIIQWIKPIDAAVDGFKEEMTKLGYTEGDKVVYTYTLVNADAKKSREVADQYVDDNVDLIYAITSQPAIAALASTKEKGRTDIPIIFAHADQPIGDQIVASYKSSGNNATGVAADIPGLTPKKLEFLQRMRPDIKKIGFFNSTEARNNHSGPAMLEEIRKDAPAVGMEVVEYEVKSPPGPASIVEMQKIADAIQSGDIQAMLYPTGTTVAQADAKKIAIGLQNRLKIPIAFVTGGDVQLGGLFAYTADYAVVGRQAADIADKVLRGTQPTDIPTEFPEKDDLLFNLKAAKDIGLTIPADLLQIGSVLVPAN